MNPNNHTESNVIEELYLTLQIIILIVLLHIAFPLLSKTEFSPLKLFCLFFFIDLGFRLYLFFKNVALDNSSPLSNHPNILLSIIDGIFVGAFIYIYRDSRIDFSNLIYIYVLLQSIRYALPLNLIFGVIATIIECFPLLYDSTQFNLIDSIGNIALIYMINLIVGFALKQIYQLQKEKQYYYEQLTQTNWELHQLATTDRLTGLKNHQCFYQNFNNLKNNAYKMNVSFCLALIDIDNFKQINDTYGHMAGDEVLRRLATILNNHTRKTDFLARYGGEEFAILFPETNKNDSIKLCERIRKAIESESFIVEDHVLNITVSIGMHCLYPIDIHNNYYSFIKEVDNLLYDAKTTGKNRVVYGTDETFTGV